MRLPLLRYGVAGVAVGQALLLKLLLPPLKESENSFLVLFVAVIVSAGYGGLGPGLLATALTALASTYFFIPPAYSWVICSDDVAWLVGFVLLALLISLVTAAHQKAEVILGSRVRQQAAIAQLGQQALCGTALSPLMQEVTSLVAQTLEVEYCKILERLPDGDALLLRAGVGWNPMIVGHMIVGAQTDSHAGYTLLAKEPVIIKDLRTETRFNVPAIFHEHGVVSGLSVIIQGSDQPFGVLSASTTWRRIFIQDDINFLQAIANVLAEAIKHQQTEGILRQSEERFRLLVEGVQDYAIFMLDPDGRVASWNIGAERILGYSEAEVLGQPVSRFFTPEDTQSGEPEAELRQALTQGRAADERWHVRKDGSRFWATGVVTPLQDGQLRGFSKVMRDITQRKQVEEQLRLKDRAIEESLNGIVITDPNQPDNPIVYCNSAFERMSGYSRDEVIGLNCRFLQGPETDPAVRDQIRHAVELGQQCGVVIQNYRKDGSFFWNELAIAPVRDSRGQLTHWIGVKTDISDRKQAELELQQLLAREQTARTKAEAANRVKDEFLATLSHELRTPLNAMLGWVQLLRTRQLNPTLTARALETIERNAKSQSQLIEDLLDISRIIRGKFRLEMRPCELAPVIEAAIDTVRPAAAAKRIDLGFEPHPGGCPELLVSGDPDRLQQVFWNLLSNAIKFTPEDGRVEVRLEQVGSYAQVRVSDTGKGISGEFLPYVFERFLQADSTSTRSYGGLGLGLAIVRYLIELHGGSVEAQSLGEGQGATFSVKLPLTTSRRSDARLPEFLAAVNGKDPSTSDPVSFPVLDGLRVLVVDDEADTRELLRTVFEQCGARVTVVASTREAITTLEQLQPDILVSDIGMPHEDGYTLIQKVRARSPQQGGKIPAVALTAYAREEDRTRALAAGFQMHMAKPVNPDKLLAIAAKLTGRPFLV